MVHHYAGEVRWLRQEKARKRLGKLTHGVVLLQDNAPANTSQVAMTAVTECGCHVCYVLSLSQMFPGPHQN